MARLSSAFMALGGLLVMMLLQVAGASKLGWMGDIENSDYENAHAVGMLGRMDPSYARSERVRSQAESLAAGASEMEAFFEKRLATLLAQGQKQGLGDKVLLSGLHTQPALSTTATLSTPLQRAETPIAAAAYTRVRVEHGSNSLLRTLGVATARRSANPAVPIKMAGEEALSSPPKNSRHMEHGSNALLKLLMGHTGIPNTGAHRNTLLYHTTHPTPSSTRKAAVARGHNAAARSGTRETVQNGLKKKASSWFWPFF